MRCLCFLICLFFSLSAVAGETVTDTACEHCQQAHDCTCDPEFSPTWTVTGFFQLDGGFHYQSAASTATLGDIEDGLGFRRARLAVTGDVAERTSYILEFDFAQAQPRFVDLWMQFDETPLGNVRIGRFRQPFGMTELTSIKELPLLERPLPFSLSPFRQTGIMLFDTMHDDRVTWAVSGYRYLSDNFGNVYADAGGYGTATRLTMLAVDDDADEAMRLVHLGFGYSYNSPGQQVVQFLNTNEFFVGQNPNLGPPGLSVLPLLAIPPFVNTGEMATAHTSLFNIEGAVSFGRFVIQSEARWAHVRLTNGTVNDFPGAYVEMRYVLTGEEVPYDRQNAIFGRITPCEAADIACGKFGTWEVAARVSHLDLNGNSLPGPGRRLTDTTVGLNWYLSKHSKFQFNWIYAALNDPTIGGSSVNTFAVRAQVDF